MTILITGASAGIGAATASLLAQKGCRVVLAARREERLAKLVRELNSEYGEGTAFAAMLDVSEPEGHERFLESLPDEWNEIDVLVANAGLAKNLVPVWENTVKEVDQMIDTNVKGVLNGVRALVPEMIKRGRGHVILLGSTAGHWVYPGGTVYCSTKFAVRAIAEGLKRDLQGTPLRVSLVSPGLVETEFTRARFDGDPSYDEKVYGSTEPLVAEDIAQAIAYCIDASPHVDVFEMLVTPRVQAGSDVLRGKDVPDDLRET